MKKLLELQDPLLYLSQGSLVPLNASLTGASSHTNTGNSLCLSRLGRFLVMSQTQAPGRLSTSLESGSGQQMSASVPHKVGSPTPITCRLFLVELFINLFVEQIGQLQLSPAL